MKTLLALAFALLAAAPSLSAQEMPPETLEAVREAAQHLGRGQFVEAIEILEPLAEAPGAPQPVLGVLGAAYVEGGRPRDAYDLLKPLADATSADPAVLYNTGRAAVAVGEAEAGVRYLERSVALQPRTPAARELGMIRGQQGHFHDAFQLLRPWVQSRPDDEEARLVAALAALRLERLPDAEALLAGLPQDEPKVRLLSGQLLLLKGDPHETVATLKPLLGHDEVALELDARRIMATAYLAYGDSAEAAALLEGKVGTDPRLAVQLARAQYQLGQLEEGLATLAPFAVEGLERLEQLGPRDRGVAGSVSLEFGRLLVATQRYEEAVPFLEAATKIIPDDKQAWQSLGQALAAAGRQEEAQVALDRFRMLVGSEVAAATQQMHLERDLADPTARELRRALSEVEAGDGEAALARLRAEIELSPNDVRPRLVEAQALLLLGRHDEALAAAERALTLAPGSADAHYQRGAVQVGLNNFAAAEVDFRTALRLSPDHTAAMNDLAVVLILDGQREEAKQLLERVLELRPDDQGAAQSLARLNQNSTR